MIKSFFAFFCLFILLISNSAQAAYPFCIVRNNTFQECIYDNVQTCIRDENSETNTYCILSATAIVKYSGFERYCTIDSNLIALCEYNDRRLCNSAARDTKSLCIDRKVNEDIVDPYRFDDRLIE